MNIRTCLLFLSLTMPGVSFAQDNLTVFQTERGQISLSVRPNGITDTGNGFMVSTANGAEQIIIYDAQKFADALKKFESLPRHSPNDVLLISEDILCNPKCLFLGADILVPKRGEDFTTVPWPSNQPDPPPQSCVPECPPPFPPVITRICLKDLKICQINPDLEECKC